MKSMEELLSTDDGFGYLKGFFHGFLAGLWMFFGIYTLISFAGWIT